MLRVSLLNLCVKAHPTGGFVGGAGKVAENQAKKKKRIYTTGMEHHPIYGPEAQRRRILDRGIKLPEQDKKEKLRAQRAATATAGTATTPPGGVDEPRADSRFYRKMKDFREMEDSDPYRDLFGERRSFVRSKVGAWRTQFEKENEDVELPYERRGKLAKTAPNWFVRWMMGVRENQGLDLMWLPIWFVGAISVIMLWYNATVMPMGKTKDVREMK